MLNNKVNFKLDVSCNLLDSVDTYLDLIEIEEGELRGSTPDTMYVADSYVELEVFDLKDRKYIVEDLLSGEDDITYKELIIASNSTSKQELREILNSIKSEEIELKKRKS